MKYISFNEIIGCNALLKEKGLHFKVHLQDSCGKQMCRIEPLGNCACEGKEDKMCATVEEYFKELGIRLEFGEDKMRFWVE